MRYRVFSGLWGIINIMAKRDGLICLVSLLSVLWLAPARGVAETLNSYHIGNSLTWDARISLGLPQLASDAGFTLDTGWHIRCGNTLDYIVSNPDSVCVECNGYGLYMEAVTDNTWDAVTLQPYSGSTPRQEYQAAKTLIQLARQNPQNLDTRFYLYANWDSKPPFGTTFYNRWFDPTPTDPDSSLIRNANGFGWIFDELKADPDLQGVELHMIPVGDVLAEIDQRMALGYIPGFRGADELYRDNLHLNNLGRFVAANTLLATLFEADPTGTPTNSSFDTSPGQTIPIEITPALATAVQGAVWDVLTTYPPNGGHSGDLNHDGFIGIQDINSVLGSWNQSTAPVTLAGDSDGDGFIGIQDLNTLLGHWNEYVTPGDMQAGDFNGDGFIGIQDLNTLLGIWNQNFAPLLPLTGDSNGDGFVGIEDLNHVLGNWNAGTPPGEDSYLVPEPSVVSILAGLCLGRTLLRPKRRMGSYSSQAQA